MFTLAQGTFWWVVATVALTAIAMVIAAWGLWLQLPERRQRRRQEELQANPIHRVRCWIQVEPIQDRDRAQIEKRTPDYDGVDALRLSPNSWPLYLQAFPHVAIRIDEANLRFLGDDPSPKSPNPPPVLAPALIISAPEWYIPQLQFGSVPSGCEVAGRPHTAPRGPLRDPHGHVGR